ncbi:ficolin-1-B-like [Physella acuta]|uniref:ficolin-1-B-like n=1 Tax=Physella acuta TaxID=109671 RepID=UPI0027DC99DC|nr:ficolin-1-B-like [Physella acuta]
MLLQLCVLVCLVSGVRADNGNGNTYNDNSTKSKRGSIDELLSMDTCRNCISTQPRQVVILSSGLEVMCDTEDGGGWMVIQRRTNGNLDFDKTWEDYKYGFGDVDVGEFWLGNEIVHRLTILRRYELKIDLTYYNFNYTARFARFRLYGEAEGYRLKVSNYTGGNAGDSFSGKHNDMKFSTRDRDNDLSGVNCAQTFTGGWWFNACHDSNLNGKWASKERLKGLIWVHTTTEYYSVERSEMKIRPL